MKKPWKVYAFWILFTEAVGALAGFLIREDVKIYAQEIIKPKFSPPAWVFPVVWTILYALMGIGMARVRLSGEGKLHDRAMGWYLLQLFFNFVWSLLFFKLQAFGFSFVWLVILWALILKMTLSFSELDPLAANLQIPYLIWVFFAGYLNYGVWMLNR